MVGKRRKPTILISTISTVFMMYALIHAPNEPVTLAFLLFLTGFLLNVGYSSFTVYPAGLTTKDAYPLAVSVVNTGGQAGGALFPFLTGLLLDAYSWDAVFLFLGASSLLALAGDAAGRRAVERDAQSRPPRRRPTQTGTVAIPRRFRPRPTPPGMHLPPSTP